MTTEIEMTIISKIIFLKMLNVFYKEKVECPECCNIEDNQYFCFSCGKESNHMPLVANILDYIKHNPNILNRLLTEIKGLNDYAHVDD